MYAFTFIKILTVIFTHTHTRARARTHTHTHTNTHTHTYTHRHALITEIVSGTEGISNKLIVEIVDIVIEAKGRSHYVDD